MNASKPKRSILLSLHSFSWRLLEVFDRITRGLWQGLWLGLLTRRHFHTIDYLGYDSSKCYQSIDHNLSGLFGWENEAIDRHFRNSRRLVLLGAGAGREVAPLREKGFDVDAFECHQGLRDAGNDLLDQNEPQLFIQAMERDHCPSFENRYDGAVLGWGMFSLVPGRKTRKTLLRELHSAVSTGAPLLLSFYVLGGSRRSFRIAARFGNAIRRVLVREDLEFGDSLSPGYAHFFTKEGLEEELREAGWSLRLFDRRTYPHAVAIAEEDAG